MTKESKKLLFIASSPMYLEKGSSLRMYAIAENLSTKYHIDLLCYSLGKPFSLKNTRIFRTYQWYKPKLKIGKPSIQKIILDFFLLMKAIRLSIFNKYDVIHCEDFEGAFLGTVLSIINPKSKIVYDLHNRVLDNLNLYKKVGPMRHIFEFVEKIIVNKTDLLILNWAKYNSHAIFKNKNRFVYYDKIDQKLTKYPIPYNKYLIYTGNFEPYQGLYEFLSVYKNFEKKIPLVLVGQPTLDIIEYIKDSGLEKNIKLVGRLSVQGTNFLIKNAICGILPRKKGSSMKLIHYIMWGVPVIAKNTESNRELLVSNYNGWLYSDDMELKKILTKLFRNDKCFTKMNPNVNKTKNDIVNVWNQHNFIDKYCSITD